jgi:hypothetical protein
MTNKTRKTGALPAAKRARAGIRRRIRKRGSLAPLDPLALLASMREDRVVKAISESTEDFKTGRYEP